MEKARVNFPLLTVKRYFYLSFFWICQIPIYARAQDLTHLVELKNAGATDAVLENTEVILISR